MSVLDPKILHALPRQHQVQCSTSDQCKALLVVADRFGLAGAHQFLTGRDVARFARKALDDVVDAVVIASIPMQPPVTGATLDQELDACRVLANRFGLYDAADLVRIISGNLPLEPEPIASSGPR